MTATRIDSTPHLLTALNLLHGAAIVERQMTRRLVHGTSFSELLLLLHLRHSPDDQLRRVDLAERLGMSQSSVTRLLGPLERRGILTREPDPTDGRAALTRLTPAGRRLVDEVRASAETAAEDTFSAMSDDDLARIDEVLRRLMAGASGGFA